MVLKLSGFAKFEVDHKMTSEHFYKMVMKLSSPLQGEETQFNHELFEKYLQVFKKALNDMQEVYKGDLENETYKNILAYMRAFNPNATD